MDIATSKEALLVKSVQESTTNGKALYTQLCHQGFTVTCQENDGCWMSECAPKQDMPDVCQYNGDNKVLLCWL